MAKKREFKGVCIIDCGSGTQRFENLTKKECMEKASTSGCAPSWISCEPGSVCQV